MRTREFGKTGITTSNVGYGAMALSLHGRPPENEALSILDNILASGVNFIDTADTYCLGPHDLHHNEALVAKATAQSSRQILIATKGGTRRSDQGWLVDGSPERLYESICASHQALGSHKPIPIWQLHWPDPRYTIAQMMRAVQRAIDERLVQFVGVCNFSVPLLQQALDLVPLVSVQNQFNLWHREAEFEGVLDFCQQHDLIFLPWRPLGGLGLTQRLDEIEPLKQMAIERGISPQRLIVAWHLAKSPCIVPIPGSSQLVHILDCLSGGDVLLDSAEMRRLDAISEQELPRRVRPSAWEGMPPLAPD